MAQKRKRKNCKKWLIRLLMVGLFVAAGAVCYLVWDAYFKTDDMMDNGGDNTVDTVVEKPVENSEIIEVNEDVVEKEKVVQYDGEDPNVSEELTGVVTYAGAAGEKLMIRVNIDQYLETGECRLKLIRGGEVVYGDVAAIATNVATATCEGFDVPISELGVGGYQIMIDLSSNGKMGVIKGDVEI